MSQPVTATTAARDGSDVTPPSTPLHFTDNGMSFQDGETWLFWEESTDDVTPQAIIVYELSVNGVVDHTIVGFGRTILYVTPGQTNTFSLVAIDEAGNRSAPSTLEITLP